AVAKIIAKSGINFAASNLSRNSNWLPTESPYSYMGTNNLEITLNDSMGTKTVTSTGTNNNKSQLVEIKIKMANFSEYAYFSNIEDNIWWTGADSVFGPFHTNDHVQVQGHPYFAGPSTSHGGIVKFFTNEATDKPSIIGKYTPGITIDIPTDGITNLSSRASSGGYTFSGQAQVFVEFAGDSIKFKFNSADPYTTVLGTDLAPNGIIYVNNGNLRIQGTVKGKWSIGSNQSVYLDGDVVYSDIPDPMDKNDSSQDLLGILAKNNVIITDNIVNNSDINIHAAIYCEDGGFTAENYAVRPVSGSINLIGGITQEQRGIIGQFNVSGGINTVTSGFDKDYKYDSRLQRMVPPYFPSTNTFKIVSWLE
ncbi:MAG: hypothetical protein V3V16_11325, partial [Melioribacteraceae bacterium]